MTCGEVKTYTGAPKPLVCNLDEDHPLPHAIRDPKTNAIYVWWPAEWTEADQAERDERLKWSKGHVRKPYQTAKQWKAARGL